MTADGPGPAVRVRIPTPLRSYTRGASAVTAGGATVRAVVADLDRQFPGLAFRMVDEQGCLRQHMIVWLEGERCRDLDAPVDPAHEVVIMQALSGG